MEVIPALIREGLDESDTPLTSRGCFQAQMTGEALREKGITQIFCSPVLRCVQTAAEISKIIGVPIKIEPGAMETLDKRWYSSQPVTPNQPSN